MEPTESRGFELIERYLQGRMSPQEEQAFEEAYLADPRLLEELKLTERLRAGFKDLAAAGDDGRGGRAAPKQSLLAFASSPRYGLAASFAAAAAFLAAGALYLENVRLQSAEGTLLARPAQVLPLVSVRGAGQPNVITAPAADEWTVLLVDTGFADYEQFNAALRRADDGEEILRLDGIVARDGTVAFGMPGSVLEAGRYEVVLEGDRFDATVGRAVDELSRTPLTVDPAP
jgi:hypothetical protein